MGRHRSSGLLECGLDITQPQLGHSHEQEVHDGQLHESAGQGSCPELGLSRVTEQHMVGGLTDRGSLDTGERHRHRTALGGQPQGVLHFCGAARERDTQRQAPRGASEACISC